jgi:molybdopterin/thiamine biosynthesis adenylyltransferase
MALPDYFGRNAVAIAQAISGLDEQRLTSALENVRVGITIARDARAAEGRAIADLLVRLLARLYPTLVFRSEHGESPAADAHSLASRINPRIEFVGEPTIEIVIGATKLQRWAPMRIMVGSRGWDASASISRVQSCGNTENPFGPGAAACLAAANLFRQVFLSEPRLDENATFRTLNSADTNGRAVTLRGDLGQVVLAGAGAIGNAAAWAFARTPMTGTLCAIDPERLDLGNLQRYVLAERSDVDAPKPAILERYFTGSFRAVSYIGDLASFIAAQTRPLDRLLLALDSARDRRMGQACLPGWIANAWTQAGDLGVSTHDFLSGACVRCLYLPERPLANEDAIIAEAFGVPQKVMEIRTLLYRNDGVPRSLLEAIAGARNLPLERLLPFEGRLVRDLYREGFCGGAVIPLSAIGAPRSDVHVPLAHQSALAGVLLAAAAVRNALVGDSLSQITQLDLLKPLPAILIRPAAKDPRGICICQDEDYRDAYKAKFHDHSIPAVGTRAAPAAVKRKATAKPPAAPPRATQRRSKLHQSKGRRP